MKIPILVIAIAFGLASESFAGPLQPNQVAGDARWVAHLDMESFLKTRLGWQLGRDFVDQKINKGAEKLNRQFEVDFDWKKIHSVTAYGWAFNGKRDINGVLVIRSEMNLGGMIEAVLEKVSGGAAGADLPFRKVESPGGAVYELKNEAFACVARDGVFLVSRSREDLQKARQVIGGSVPSMATAKSFGGLHQSQGAFLVVGVAEGFSDSLELPKQARMLKEASGLQLSLGEKADRLFVNLALDAKSAEAATQIQQLLQGLVALALLNGEANKDLQQLAQSARVNGKEKQVLVNLEMPVTNVLARIPKPQSAHRRPAAVEPNH